MTNSSGLRANERFPVTGGGDGFGAVLSPLPSVRSGLVHMG
jgi:hypothetical protein